MSNCSRCKSPTPRMSCPVCGPAIDNDEGGPFTEGYDAQVIGRTVAACPYDDFTEEADAWVEGWSVSRGESTKAKS